MPNDSEGRLGTYLKDRRARLDPQALGFPATRRRTPGLRREEVAQRANISATWYTWLEQGRGGAPSAAVLHRIAGALMLTDEEREHVFLLGLGRPPEVHYRGSGSVTPRLQHVLDALSPCPALVKSVTWDVVAWNRAATVVLADYAAMAPRRRNILRMIFCEPHMRRLQSDWEQSARFVVAAFRADVARAGAAESEEVVALVDELTRAAPEFEGIWRSNDVRSYGEGVKQLRHPVAGPLAFEYSAFQVDGRPDLAMVVFHPLGVDDRVRIEGLLASAGAEASVQVEPTTRTRTDSRKKADSDVKRPLATAARTASGSTGRTRRPAPG